MGSVPNADHGLLCPLYENSLICLYCSTETPCTNAFPTAPDDTTSSMIFMYPHAVLGLFQKGRSMMEERSSPIKALMIALPRTEIIHPEVSLLACRTRMAFQSERHFRCRYGHLTTNEGSSLRERCSGINIPGYVILRSQLGTLPNTLRWSAPSLAVFCSPGY